MSRWGLATLGGLLLGGAACTPANAELPPPGVAPPARVEKKPEGKAVRLPDAGAPDKDDKAKADEADKSPEKKTGKKANQKDPKAGKDEQAGAARTGTTGSPAPTKPDRSRMMGKMPMPRPDPSAPTEKQKSPEK